MEKPGHLSGLDSLRFFAFLGIYLFHTTESWSFGYLGIQLFFVLSSFLITMLALKEIHDTGSFSRKNFFIRRALRIYPLYYLVVAVSLLLLPTILNQFGKTITLPAESWKYWFFLSNFEQSDHLYALKFLWSISVEEQFYILFIFLSYFFFRNIYIPIIILYVLHFSAPLFNNAINPYYNPVTYFAEFATGMLAAKLYADKSILLSSNYLVPAALLGCTFSLISFNNPHFEWLFNIWFSFTIASVILLTIANFPSSGRRNIFFTLTEFLGKFTYGLYVYSGFIITLGSTLFPEMTAITKNFLQFLFLLIISISSYYLFEKRWLELKKYARK